VLAGQAATTQALRGFLDLRTVELTCCLSIVQDGLIDKVQGICLLTPWQLTSEKGVSTARTLQTAGRTIRIQLIIVFIFITQRCLELMNDLTVLW